MARRRATETEADDLPRYFVWVRGLEGPEPQKWMAMDFGVGDWKRPLVLAYLELPEGERHLPLSALARRYPAARRGFVEGPSWTNARISPAHQPRASNAVSLACFTHIVARLRFLLATSAGLCAECTCIFTTQPLQPLIDAGSAARLGPEARPRRIAGRGSCRTMMAR
ncbi:hypothetical protein ABIB68_003152 [Bradyrhizobium sp. F1.2.2]